MVILGTVDSCFTHITSLFQTHPTYSVCEVGYTLLRSGEPALSGHGGKLVNTDAFGDVPRFLFDVKTYENLMLTGERPSDLQVQPTTEMHGVPCGGSRHPNMLGLLKGWNQDESTF